MNRDTGQTIAFRAATAADGTPMWRFVRDAGVLELNTAYAYILMCQHFGDTCLIAERGSEMVGFVLAYRPPHQHDSVFVWQVGVAQSARGQGLGGRLLDQLLELDGCKGVQYLEASVTPDNVPSRKLFRGFARRQDAECQELPFFPAEYFPEGHEREDLFRIGPIERPNN